MLTAYVADKLTDYIDADLDDSAFDEVMEIATAAAVDDYTVDTVDGDLVDITDYAGIAARALEEWAEGKKAEHDERGDYLRDM